MTLAHDSAGWALADIDDILKEGTELFVRM